MPTAVFTPLEYSCIGMSEEQAIEAYGAENVEVNKAHSTKKLTFFLIFFLLLGLHHIFQALGMGTEQV